MNRHFGNTDAFAANDANSDYELVVDDSVVVDVDIEVIEEDEPEIEILGADYGDSSVDLSVLADGSDYVLIEVMPDDIDDIVEIDDNSDVDVALDVIDDTYDDVYADDDLDIDDADVGGEFM